MPWFLFFLLLSFNIICINGQTPNVRYDKGDYTFNISYNVGSHSIFTNSSHPPFTIEKLSWEYNNTDCVLGGYQFFPVQGQSELLITINFTGLTFFNELQVFLEDESLMINRYDSSASQVCWYNSTLTTPKCPTFYDVDLSSNQPLLKGSKLGAKVFTSPDIGLDLLSMSISIVHPNSNFEWKICQIYPIGKPITNNPTTLPTVNPTVPPPTQIPSENPTENPTKSPSLSPTPSPTWPRVETKSGGNKTYQYSVNIYPLSERTDNVTTYSNYKPPGGGKYCIYCLLAWTDIDASIVADGCNSSDTRPNGGSDNTPSDYYFCNGTWILRSSARLLTYKDTYGKVEVWEVDDNDIKHLQWRMEFQWNGSVCEWETGSGREVCDRLPLTPKSDCSEVEQVAQVKKKCEKNALFKCCKEECLESNACNATAKAIKCKNKQYKRCKKRANNSLKSCKKAVKDAKKDCYKDVKGICKDEDDVDACTIEENNNCNDTYIARLDKCERKSREQRNKCKKKADKKCSKQGKKKCKKYCGKTCDKKSTYQDIPEDSTCYDEKRAKCIENKCSDNTAMIEFTMPKTNRDNRTQPLIVVWYDISLIPYAIRPNVYDEYYRLNLTTASDGAPVGFAHIWSLEPLRIGGIVLVCLLGVLFIIVCWGVFSKEEHKIDLAEMIIDDRNLKTLYTHDIENLIVDEREIRQAATFDCGRHGPYLCLVINSEHFHVLDQYGKFAAERDAKLWNASALIESYYDVESARMEDYITLTTDNCFDAFTAQADEDFQNGEANQSAYHTAQMEEPFNYINDNTTTIDRSVQTGATACSFNSTGLYDVGSYTYFEENPYSGKITAKEFTLRDNFNRSSPDWQDVFDTLDARCLDTQNCVGFTFIDSDPDIGGLPNFAFYLTEPKPEWPGELEGVCMVVYRANNPFNLNVTSLLRYTDVLENDYISDYEVEVDFGFAQLDNLWVSLLSQRDDAANETFYRIRIEQNPALGATYFNAEVQLDEIRTKRDPITDELNSKAIIGIYITCGSCHETANFTAPTLQEVQSFLDSWNISNLTDETGREGSNIPNFTDKVSVPSENVEIPKVPTINLPPGVEVPGFGTIIPYVLLLDALLIIYRWYKLAGAVAAILKGRDVEVRTSSLLIHREAFLDKFCEPCCNLLKNCICCRCIEVCKTIGNCFCNTTRCCILCWCSPCVGVCRACSCCDCVNKVVGENEFGESCAQSWIASVAGCVDKFSNLSYVCWKFCYWIWIIMYLCIMGIVILIAYVIVDQVVNPKFITKIGAFDILTFGLAAQRAVRNQILSTTALSYNNLTLVNLESSRTVYAIDKNLDAWRVNIAELNRVDEWNGYFCPAWKSYLANPKEIFSNYGTTVTDISSSVGFPSPNTNWTARSVDNVLLNDTFSSSYFVPFTDFEFAANDTQGGRADVNITFEFPLQIVSPRENLTSYWEVTTITITHDFLPGSSADYQNDSCIQMTWYGKLKKTDPWEVWVDAGTDYCGTSLMLSRIGQDYYDEELVIDVQRNETRYVQVRFENAGASFGDFFRFKNIEFAGNIPLDNIACPYTEFRYWDYDASETYVKTCPEVNPVFGSMYRGFVREAWKKDLQEAHLPYIIALRNICLSVFTIMLVALMILLCAAIVAFIVDKFLQSMDLYRVNLYAKVPLVDIPRKEELKKSKKCKFHTTNEGQEVKAYSGNPSVMGAFWRKNDNTGAKSQTNGEKAATNNTKVEMITSPPMTAKQQQLYSSVHDQTATEVGYNNEQPDLDYRPVTNENGNGNSTYTQEDPENGYAPQFPTHNNGTHVPAPPPQPYNDDEPDMDYFPDPVSENGEGGFTYEQ